MKLTHFAIPIVDDHTNDRELMTQAFQQNSVGQSTTTNALDTTKFYDRGNA